MLTRTKLRQAQPIESAVLLFFVFAEIHPIYSRPLTLAIFSISRFKTIAYTLIFWHYTVFSAH